MSEQWWPNNTKSCTECATSLTYEDILRLHQMMKDHRVRDPFVEIISPTEYRRRLPEELEEPPCRQ